MRELCLGVFAVEVISDVVYQAIEKNSGPSRMSLTLSIGVRSLLKLLPVTQGSSLYNS